MVVSLVREGRRRKGGKEAKEKREGLLANRGGRGERKGRKEGKGGELTIQYPGEGGGWVGGGGKAGKSVPLTHCHHRGTSHSNLCRRICVHHHMDYCVYVCVCVYVSMKTMTYITHHIIVSVMWVF